MSNLRLAHKLKKKTLTTELNFVILIFFSSMSLDLLEKVNPYYMNTTLQVERKIYPILKNFLTVNCQ